MKCKKTDMRGAGFWGRTGSRLKKAAVGTRKVFTHGMLTKTPSTTYKSKFGKIVGTPTAVLVTYPTRKLVKGVIESIKMIPRQFKGRTRSGKAKKLLRQVTGITNYNELKRKADKITRKTDEYKRLRNDLERTIMDTTTGSKDKHQEKIDTLTRKIEHQEFKAGLIETKWRAQLDKKKRDISTGETALKLDTTNVVNKNSEGKTRYDPTTGDILMRKKTISEHLADAEKHFEDEASKITQESLEKVEKAKAAYMTATESYTKARADIKVQQDIIATQKQVREEAEKEYRAAGSDKKKQNSARQIIKAAGAEITKARKQQLNLENGALKTAIAIMNTKEVAEARRNYEAAQQAYIKRMGKAHSIKNLSNRAKESVFKSLGRALTIPPIFERMDRKITSKSKIIDRANTAEETKNVQNKSVKRDRDWIVGYYSKQKSGRPQKLAKKIIEGKTYLGSYGDKKQFRKGDDGKFKLDPTTKKPIPMTLRDIIQESLEKGTTIETMPNKEFEAHLSKLQEDGTISIKDYEAIHTYHTAHRIQNMINTADITQKKGEIDTSLTKLSAVKAHLGSDYGKTLFDVNKLKAQGNFIKIGEDEGKNGLKYKVTLAYVREFEEEAKQRKLALDSIDKETNPKLKQNLINYLYKKYYPGTPEQDVPKSDEFNRDIIEKDDSIIHNKVRGNKVFEKLSSEYLTAINLIGSSKDLKNQLEEYKNLHHEEIIGALSVKDAEIKAHLEDEAIKQIPNDDEHKHIEDFHSILQFTGRLKDLQAIRDKASNTPEDIQTLKDLEGNLGGIKLVDANGRKITDDELKNQLLEEEGKEIFNSTTFEDYKKTNYNELIADLKVLKDNHLTLQEKKVEIEQAKLGDLNTKQQEIIDKYYDIPGLFNMINGQKQAKTYDNLTQVDKKTHEEATALLKQEEELKNEYNLIRTKTQDQADIIDKNEEYLNKMGNVYNAIHEV
jgi:hypothetical protein